MDTQAHTATDNRVTTDTTEATDTDNSITPIRANRATTTARDIRHTSHMVTATRTDTDTRCILGFHNLCKPDQLASYVANQLLKIQYSASTGYSSGKFLSVVSLDNYRGYHLLCLHLILKNTINVRTSNKIQLIWSTLYHRHC